jgi:pyocin large subunit-like protein
VSIAAIRWAFSLSIKPASAKFILVALANHVRMAGDPISYPSNNELCEMTGLDRKTVIQGLAQLMSDEIISDTKKRKGTTGQVIVYRLNICTKSPEIGTLEESQDRHPYGAERVPFLP